MTKLHHKTVYLFSMEEQITSQCHNSYMCFGGVITPNFHPQLLTNKNS